MPGSPGCPLQLHRLLLVRQRRHGNGLVGSAPTSPHELSTRSGRTQLLLDPTICDQDGRRCRRSSVRRGAAGSARKPHQPLTAKVEAEYLCPIAIYPGRQDRLFVTVRGSKNKRCWLGSTSLGRIWNCASPRDRQDLAVYSHGRTNVLKDVINPNGCGLLFCACLLLKSLALRGLAHKFQGLGASIFCRQEQQQEEPQK